MKKVKLVLSGSGVKFPVFVGAIKRLEEAGYQFIEIVGTSGGSIVGAALATGMNSTKIESLCKGLLPGLIGLLDPSILSLLTDFGFIKGKKIQEVLARNLPGTLGKTKIPLHVVTTNFDTEIKEVFSSSTHPGLDISRAVRASIAIPIVFTPALINGDLYIDGGVFANFPIDFFGNDQDVIGLNFVAETGKRKPRPKGLMAVFSFVARVIDMLILAKTNDDIEDVTRPNVINLTTKTTSLDFFIDEKQVDAMIKEGYDATDKWLKRQSNVPHK